MDLHVLALVSARAFKIGSSTNLTERRLNLQVHVRSITNSMTYVKVEFDFGINNDGI